MTVFVCPRRLPSQREADVANRRQNMAAIVAGAVLLTGRNATAADEPLTIEVRVANYTDIGSEHLLPAEAQAAKVFAAIGVRLRWVGERQDGPVPPENTFTVRVVLIFGAMENRMIRALRVRDGVLGHAAAAARTAHIFCNRVVSTAAIRAIPLANVLGRIIAHKLGHLVLPANSHSEFGIMREKLLSRSDRLDYFTEEQGARIRQLLEISQLAR